jgi:aryl-alcohol dehydrogenase-like predicted oxidoreductase
LLAYHDQLRQLSSGELSQEITRINATIAANAQAASPAQVLELALALVQNRANADVTRALAVLDPLVRSTAPELVPWQPLARLLMARLSDQRRMEELLERQTNTLRETQRNLLQTSEKLEALKAIERSLNAKPGKPP